MAEGERRLGCLECPIARGAIVRMIRDGTVGGAGLEQALATLWGDVPAQRCAVHMHRNLIARAAAESIRVLTGH